MYVWKEVWKGTWQLVDVTQEEYMLELAKRIMEEDRELLLKLRDM